MSITGAITVVGEEPSERHVIVCITVNSGAGGELVVAFFAVEAFLYAAVILLTFVVALSVLKQHEAVLLLRPVVAIIGIKMPLVETKLRQEHRITCQLVEIIEQPNRAIIHHDESIEILLAM